MLIRKLGVALRVLISVGILGFLLHTIFRAEAAEYFTARGVDPSQLGWWDRTTAVWSIGSHRLWSRLQDMQLAWMALSIGLYGIANALVIVRWQRILRVQELELPLRRTASILLIGQFFNAFMLGAAGGDVAKAWYVARETHHKKAEAVTTIAVDRLIGLGSLLVLALVTMAIFHRRVAGDARLQGFAIVVAIVTAATIAVAVIGLWRGFPTAFPSIHAWLGRRRGYATWRRVVGAYRRYAAHPRLIVEAMVMSFSVHAASILAIVCVGTGLGVTASTVDYFLYLPIIFTAAAIPISIGGFGVREGMYVLLFGAVGVGASQAVALSLLGHIAALSWSVVGGVVFLAHRRDRPTADEPSDEPEEPTAPAG